MQSDDQGERARHKLRIVIENCSRAVNVSRGAKFLGHALGQHLAVETSVAKEMRASSEFNDKERRFPIARVAHAPVASGVTPKQSLSTSAMFTEGADHRKSVIAKTITSTGTLRYPAVLKQIFRSAINATPTEKLVRTSFFPCFNISPSTACTAR